MARFTKIAEDWIAIPGKPSEFGVELAELEETAGEKVVANVVASYSKSNEVAERSGILVAAGSARSEQTDSEEMDEYEVEVRKYAKEEGTTYEKALVVFATSDGKKFDAWHQRELDKRED